MKKFWMIGLLALASANSFQTTRAADNTIYQPIFKKLNVARLPQGDITKAVQALETPPQGGQSNQTQTSDSQKNTDLITALKKINQWDDRISAEVSSNKKIADYLSDLGEIASKLNQVTRRPELNPIEQHIITIKKEIRGKDITSSEFGQITGTKNIRLIPLKFFNNGQVFNNETLNKATVFELEQAMLDVHGINEKTRTDIESLIENVKNKKDVGSIKITVEGQGDIQKIVDAVNRVIDSQGVGNAKTDKPAETTQKKEPEQKTPSRRQRRLANQNKGDKKGKKKSFWKKLRFWKWFRKKKKNKTNQTAAAPKRRSQSLKPTVTVTDVPAKNNPEAKKTEVTTNNQQPPSGYRL